MSLLLLPVLRQRFFDQNGDPLAFGKLYSYIAGTSTPLGTYQDADGSTPNQNPIELDADGYADVYILSGGGAYKFVLTDANDVEVWSVDDVDGSSVTEVSGWTEHTILDGQSATALIGETIDFDDFSSVVFDVEIIRGTGVIRNYPGQLAIQNLNGTARVVVGLGLANEDDGVTFSVSQVGTVAQLKAAATAGAGAGTIKLSKRYVPA